MLNGSSTYGEKIAFMRILISVGANQTALLIPSNEGNIISIPAGQNQLDAAVAARMASDPWTCRAKLSQGGAAARAVAPYYLDALGSLLYQVRAALEPVLQRTAELDIKLHWADLAGSEALAEHCLAEPGCLINVQAFPAQVHGAQSCTV